MRLVEKLTYYNYSIEYIYDENYKHFYNFQRGIMTLWKNEEGLMYRYDREIEDMNNPCEDFYECIKWNNQEGVTEIEYNKHLDKPCLNTLRYDEESKELYVDFFMISTNADEERAKEKIRSFFENKLCLLVKEFSKRI